MAQLIRLPSGLVVNLDNVSMIAEDTSRVYFVGSEDDFVTITDDAVTLRAWLDTGGARDIAAEMAGRQSPVIPTYEESLEDATTKKVWYQDELVRWKGEARHVTMLLSDGRLVLDNDDTVLQSEVLAF